MKFIDLQLFSYDGQLIITGKKEKIMKKFMSILLASMMILAGCGNTQSDSNTDAETTESGNKVVRVGVFEPQTGDNGPGGKQETLGIQYANYLYPTIEIGGETYDVKLEIVDNRTSPENGPSAASALVDKDVSIVLGSYGSGVSMAGGKVFKEAGVAAIGVSCTNPQVTADNECYFRVCFIDPFQGPALASYAKNGLGVDTAYTLSMLGSEYDQGLVHYFTEAFEKLGGKVISDDFPKGTANFISYINNAKNAGAKVIFAPVSINYAQLIIEAAHSQGFEGSLLGSDTWDSNMVAQSTIGKNVDVAVTTFYQEGVNPEFDEGIKAWINASPDAKTNNAGNDIVSGLTTMGYDAYLAAMEAIKIADSADPAKVLEAMPKVSFEGVSGHIEFNEVGDAKREEAVIKSADTETGLWKFVKIQKVEQ